MADSSTITNQTPKEKPVVITSEGNKKEMFKFSFVNPKILGAMAVFVLLIGGVGTGVYLTQNRQQPTTQASLSQVDLKFQPDKIDVVSGQEFNVDVFAGANDNQINNVELSLKYDPAILTLKSITPGQFLPKILIPPKIASGSATISLGTDGNSGVSGNGVIAGLKFQANNSLSQSSGKITFDSLNTKISILNRSQESINTNLGDVEVNIKTAGQADSQSAPAGALTQSLSVAAKSPEASGAAKAADSSDFNDDGLTNSIDLSLMYSGWGNPETDTQKKADLNHDGVINGMDYSTLLPKFKSNWCIGLSVKGEK